jgi:putative copper resistance protein D
LDELLILVRAIHLASSAMIAGGAIFIHLVVRPSFDVDHVFRPVRRQLRLWLGGNLLVAILSSVAWLALIAAQIADRPVSEVLTDGTVWIVLTQTQFGVVWQLRLLCAGLLAAIILPFENTNSLSLRRSAALAPTMGILYIGGLAWTGHAGAAPGTQGYLHLGADVLHLVAAGAWLGGLPALALLFGKTQRAGDSNSQELMYRVTCRFSDFGVISVTVLLVSGLINSWFLVGSIQALIDTDYGHILLVKIVLFLAMVSFATANRFRHLPRSSPGSGAPQIADALRQLRRNTITETCLGLGILVVVGKLGIVEPVAHLGSHLH